MGTVWDLMKRLEKIKIMEIAAQTMEDTRSDFIEWQKEQLYTGKTRTGAKIKPKYRMRTVRYKIKKGQPYDRVTLKDRGDFYNAIFVDVREVTYVVDSHDWKSYKLQAKYSENIFLLGGVYLRGYRQDFYPVFIQNIKKELKL